MKASEFKKRHEQDIVLVNKQDKECKDSAKLCIWIRTRDNKRGGAYVCDHPKGSGCGGGVCRQYYRQTRCLLYATPDTEVDKYGVPIKEDNNAK